MPAAPRTIGLPLDVASARARAKQISALAEPQRLQALSVLANADETDRTIAIVARELALPDADVLSLLSSLETVGLLSPGAGSTWQLTADAWVRFGRLLTTAPGPRMDDPTVETGTGSLVPLPPVVERIARDLSYRYSSFFSRETVAKYVAESYELLADRARITRFLPSLTSRFATDRLSALATARGLTLRGTPEVLFVCVANAGRSQIAAAIVRHLAGDKVHVRTAGSAPASSVHPTVAEVLDEIGVPLAAEFPKPLTDEVVQASDFVITMGCGDACPIYPGRRYMDWALDDPLGRPIEEVRLIRDDIADHVRDLLREMGVEHSG